MIKKLKSSILIFASLAMLLTPALVPAVASADSISDCVSQGSGISNALGANGGASCTAAPGSTTANVSSLNGIIKTIVNVFSIIVGVIAVIMIIVGGFKYITSGGDSGKVGSAKNTIIFAIVGLIIVALAQFIVHFVLNQANSITTTSGGAASSLVSAVTSYLL